MNNLLKYALGLFMFAFISCNKDNIDDTIKIDDPHTPEISVTNSLLTRSLTSAEGLEMGCFEVLYPFTLIDIDNNNYTISDEDDWNNLLQDSNLILIVDFIYPITISDSNGDETTIQNTDQLVEAFSSCTPTGGWTNDGFPAYNINYENSCYTIDYPISLEDASGTVVVADDENEFNVLLASDLYFFVFPFNLIDENNSAITVNNVDEIFTLLASCSGFDIDTFDIDWEVGFSQIGCYELVFPLSVTISNGTTTGATLIVNNEQELADLFLSGQFLAFNYPLSLSTDDNQIITVNSEEELIEALNECDIISVPGNTAFFLLSGSEPTPTSPACYTINYPITVEAKGSGVIQTVIVNNQQELLDLLLTGQFFEVNLIYPVSVTLTEDNSTVTLQNDDDLINLILNCN